MPLVSVVIPTYNRDEMLRRAISSVLSQTFRDFELLVVSDGSTDKTDEVVASFRDPRIRLLKQENRQGASAARNAGMKVSCGKFIAFLDDDDEWLPEKLQKQMACIQQCPESVGMVYCWMDYYDGQKNLIGKHHPTFKGYVFEHVLDKQRIGGCPTLLVRRAVVERVGGFDEALWRGNDGDFIRRICLEYEVDFIPEALVKVYTDHGSGRITSNSACGIQNAIRGQRIKLTKFKNELSRYTKQAANIYANIAYHYGQLGEWSQSIAYYRRAFATDCFSGRAYRFLLRSLIDIVRGRKIEHDKPSRL